MQETLFFIVCTVLLVFSLWVLWYIPKIRRQHAEQRQRLDDKLQQAIGKNLVLEKDLQQMQAENRTLHQQLLKFKPGADA